LIAAASLRKIRSRENTRRERCELNEFVRSPTPRLRILIADIAAVDARLQAILAGDALSFARTSGEAQRKLELAPFDLAVVCLRFDESRMFDLLGHIRDTPSLATLPVACVRGDGVHADAPAIERYRRSALAVGASALVDFEALPAGEAGNDSIRRQLYGCIDKGTRMARSSTYTRTLQHACETAGGHQALARLLGVDPADLSRWLRGVEFPPFKVFMAALDIIANGPYGVTPPGMRAAGRSGDSAG